MMKYIPKIIFSLLFSQLSNSAKAQVKDSLSSINTEYQTFLNSDETALDLLFYKHNDDVLLNDLGPYGSINYYLTAKNIFNRNIFYTNFLKRDLSHLNGVKPFTNITYVNASRKEQFFSISHIQQFGKLMSLEFDFRRISSPGEYINQEANYSIFKGSFGYNSKRNNYSLLFNTDINRHRNQENGGLDSLSIENFQNNPLNNRQDYIVNLTQSDVVIKKYNYELNQRLNLFSFKRDSLNSKNVYINMFNEYSSNERVFNDNDPLSSIYDNIFADSISSIDSIYQNNFRTDLSLGYSNENIDLAFSTSLDRVNYFQATGLDTTYNNFYVGLKSSFDYRKTRNNFTFEYGVSGYRQNDVSSKLEVDYPISENIDLSLGIGYHLSEAKLNFVNYSSNHFMWNNLDLKKQGVTNFNVDLEFKKWQLIFSADNKLLSNTLYFNELALAEQNEGEENISTFSVTKKYKVLNFYFRTSLKYQITSDKFLFPLPDIIGRQVAYYEKSIFKKVLKVQLGFSVTYSSKYYGYAYSPALTQFYVQTSNQLGNYPNVDVFINMHLKRAQLFLKYERINDTGNLDRAFSVPTYPLLGRSFKFGLSWNLFD